MTIFLAILISLLILVCVIYLFALIDSEEFWPAMLFLILVLICLATIFVVTG